VYHFGSVGSPLKHNALQIKHLKKQPFKSESLWITFSGLISHFLDHLRKFEKMHLVLVQTGDATFASQTGCCRKRLACGEVISLLTHKLGACDSGFFALVRE
jgi:hypothetical protein